MVLLYHTAGGNAMTRLYYVRHARPDYSEHDDQARPLTADGRRDTAKVTAWLADKGIAAVYASPFLRAADTVRPFAEAAGLPVLVDEDLRERKITDEWIEDFDDYTRRQWADFDYALPGGESLRQVQQRGAAAFGRILARHPGQAVALGGHGTALCALVALYRPGTGLAYFEGMRRKMPWGVCFEFDEDGRFAGMTEQDLV